MPSKNIFSFATLLCLTAALGLSGCASHMSKEDCSSSDFYKMGLKDGKDGENTDRLNKATADCQQYGVAVPADRYNYGRQVGLTSFCSDSRARSDAADGAANATCAPVPPYQNAYNAEVENNRKEKAADLAKVQQSQNDLIDKEAKLRQDLNKIKQQQQSAPTTQQ